MPPAVVAAIASAVPAVIKAGKGIAQKRAAKKIKVGERTVQPEYQKYLAAQRTRAAAGKMPGQDRMEEKIEQASADAIKRSRTSGSPNRYLQEVSKQANTSADKIADVGYAAAKYRDAMLQKSDQAMLNIGQERSRIEEANRAEAITQKTGVGSAGSENIMAGSKDLIGTGLKAYLASKGVSGDFEKSTGESAGEGSEMIEKQPIGQPTGSDAYSESDIEALKAKYGEEWYKYV